ncbi:hypothetical protein [Pelagibacterium sediminicola]|uniref:hypothetical protein n=1 Tax=Pelagibacterium sediminicola TaxID=2248761 RepID=UPI000E3234BC|nr:hypothetical protein [Pelagibacterium sediminicola]
MSKTGWQFIAPALKKEGLNFTHACVRIDGHFGQVPVEDLRSWLEQMTFLDDPSDKEWQDNPDPTPPGRAFDFALWDNEGHVWYPSSHDGVAHLGSRPALPAAWLRDYRKSIDEPGLIEIERDFVGEIERIVAIGPEVTEIPEEYRWNSAEVDFDPDRDSAYHVAREAMRNHIAHLSAQVEKLENEIVETGVEMGELDSTDRDAIEATIAKYRAGLADRIIHDIEGWHRALPGSKKPLSIRVEGLPDHVAERLEVLAVGGLQVKIEIIDGQDSET